jgi:hypothetical protein
MDLAKSEPELDFLALESEFRLLGQNLPLVSISSLSLSSVAK